MEPKNPEQSLTIARKKLEDQMNLSAEKIKKLKESITTISNIGKVAERIKKKRNPNKDKQYNLTKDDKENLIAYIDQLKNKTHMGDKFYQDLEALKISINNNELDKILLTPNVLEPNNIDLNKFKASLETALKEENYNQENVKKHLNEMDERMKVFKQPSADTQKNPVKPSQIFSDSHKNVNPASLQKIYKQLNVELIAKLEEMKEFAIHNSIDFDTNETNVTIAKLKQTNYTMPVGDILEHIAKGLDKALKISANLENQYKQKTGQLPYKFANDNNNFFINFINKLSQLIHNVLVYLNIKKQTIPPELTEIQANLKNIKGAVEQHQKDLQPKPTSPQ